MPTLGVVILSLQGMRHLAECLKSVQWADFVAVLHVGEGEPLVKVDPSSSLVLRKITSPGQVKQICQEVRADWFLHLWGEERVGAELAEELRALCKREPQQGALGYRIPIRSYLLSRWAEGSLLGPSPALRLAREAVEVTSGWWKTEKGGGKNCPQLRGWIEDYSAVELSDGVKQLQSLSDLWAQQLRARGQSFSPVAMALHPLRVFTRLIFMNRVFSCGFAGLTLSTLAAYATLLGGAKAWEAGNVNEGKGWRVAFARMVQEWTWGITPPGFKRVSLDQMKMMVVREDLESYLAPGKFLETKGTGKKPSPFHGRERLSFFHLENGETALVRSYRHGGILRRLTGDFFFTWPPRPFRELVITEEARRRDVWTPEIFGAWVERAWGPFYRGWLLTREVEGAHDLWETLRRKIYVGVAGELLLRGVAQSLRRMHSQGICHRDLNLKNILIRQEGSEIKSYIIDFDKARLFPGEVPVAKAQKNLRRLLRSICKLDPDRRSFTEEDWEFFIRSYREGFEG